MIKHFIILIGFIIGLLSSGCAAYMARYDLRTNERSGDPVTAYLSGGAADLRGIHSGLTAPFRKPINQDNKVKKSRFSQFISSLFYLADLPFSVALDILVIPSDYYYIKKKQTKNKLFDSLMHSAE